MGITPAEVCLASIMVQNTFSRLIEHSVTARPKPVLMPMGKLPTRTLFKDSVEPPMTSLAERRKYLLNSDVNSKLILPFPLTSEKLAHTHMKLNLKLEKDHSMSLWLFMKTIHSPRSPIQIMKSLCQTISTLVSVETISVTLVTLLSPRTV